MRLRVCVALFPLDDRRTGSWFSFSCHFVFCGGEWQFLFVVKSRRCALYLFIELVLRVCAVTQRYSFFLFLGLYCGVVSVDLLVRERLRRVPNRWLGVVFGRSLW